jgi:hypothetical protein
LKYVIQSRKTIILAAFLSIMSFSILPMSQVDAHSLNKNTDGLVDLDQPDETVVAAALPLQTPVVQENPQTASLPLTQRPIEVVPVPEAAPVGTSAVVSAPVMSVRNAPQQRTSQQKAVIPQQRAIKLAVVQPTTSTFQPVVRSAVASRLLDTSAGVISTANFQSAGASNAKGSLYISNKLDPETAQNLLFAGIATITTGTLVYGTTKFLFRK